MKFEIKILMSSAEESIKVFKLLRSIEEEEAVRVKNEIMVDGFAKEDPIAEKRPFYLTDEEKKKRRRRWTSYELDFIQENYKTMKYRALAKILHRSDKAIGQVISKMIAKGMRRKINK